MFSAETWMKKPPNVYAGNFQSVFSTIKCLQIKCKDLVRYSIDLYF